MPKPHQVSEGKQFIISSRMPVRDGREYSNPRASSGNKTHLPGIGSYSDDIRLSFTSPTSNRVTLTIDSDIMSPSGARHT